MDTGGGGGSPDQLFSEAGSVACLLTVPQLAAVQDGHLPLKIVCNKGRASLEQLGCIVLRPFKFS